MAHKSFNRMRGTATAPGTSSFTLAAATGPAQTFGSRLASTNRVWYAAADSVSRWEVGYGTFTSPTTLARTTILESSNSDLVVDFNSGTVDVFCDLPASVLDTLNLIEETVASATTCDIGAIHGLKILISGTTTITGLGASTNKLRFVRFSGVLTLTHNATSLILPGGANITTAAGDTAIFASDASGNWRCYAYQRGGNGPVVDVHGADIASASTVNLETATGDLVDITGTTTITAVTLADGHERTVRFTGILTLTNGASLILPGGANITTAAGDFAVFRGYASSVVRCVDYERANRYTTKDEISIHGADIASATTTNLETATGDLVDVTGTTTITAITLSEGHERTVRFTGALTLTHGSSLVLPGAANITTAAGDFAVFRGYAAGVVRCVDYTRANGNPPIAVLPASAGGTGDTGGAWVVTTPTPTTDLGAFTGSPSASLSTLKVGRGVDLSGTINTGTGGRAGGILLLNLPYTAAVAGTGSAMDVTTPLVGGLVRILAGGTQLLIYKYDGTAGLLTAGAQTIQFSVKYQSTT